MALTITVAAGFNFPANTPITLAGLRRAALPTIVLSGSVGNTDLAAGAVTAAKATADAYWYALDTGAVNACVVTLSPVITAYTDGLEIAFKVANTNTGAATVNVNGLGAVSLFKNANAALAAGDLVAGQIVVARYRLDANLVPANATYSGAGNYTLTGLTIGNTYTWTQNVNDTSLTCGATNLTGTGTFTATATTATLAGSANLGVTAAVNPATNGFQMISQLGNPPQVPTDYQGATNYAPGVRGYVTPAAASQQQYVFCGDGQWRNLAAQAAAAAANAAGTPYLAVLQSLSFC